MKRIAFLSIVVIVVSLFSTNAMAQQKHVSSKTITVKGVSFVMVPVEKGSFQMGSWNGESGETPVHTVTISHDYWMGETEVTQELWEAVMGSNVRLQRDKADTSWPLRGEGANFPMYYISWKECQSFVKKLSSLTGQEFRLPTEAEWEYAARGGMKSRGYTYSGSNSIDEVAWYTSNSNDKTHPVKSKKPNELGLYDMSGNVWEWCQDWYGKEYYSSSPSTDPAGPSSGSGRVNRGGGWYYYAERCRVAYRIDGNPDCRDIALGLRLSASSLK